MFIEIQDAQDVEEISRILRLLIARGFRPYVEIGVRRSAAQNRKFHALCRELSKITGHTPSEIKQWAKQKVLGNASARSHRLDQETFSQMIEEMESLLRFVTHEDEN